MKKRTFEFSPDGAVEFTNEGDEFVRVAPYCDAPQVIDDGKKVIQRFDLESAKEIVKNFKENASRLVAKLGFANTFIPFYNGHPDHPHAKSDKGRDMRVYAEAEDLEAREDGLWAKIKRSEYLDNLKEKLGKLEISPRWTCTGGDDGIFKPFELLSFGLVGKGNLVGADCINEVQWFSKDELQQIADKVGTGTEGTDPVSVASVLSALDEKFKAYEENAKARETELANAKSETEAANGKISEKDKEIGELRETITGLQNELADFLVKKAHSEKKITPAQAESYKAAFAKDFINTRKELEALGESPEYKKTVDVAAINEADDATRATETDKAAAKAKLANMVNDQFAKARATNPHATYFDAIQAVCATAEGKKLYDLSEK